MITFSLDAMAIPLDTFGYSGNGQTLLAPKNGTISVVQSGSGAFGGTRSVELNSIGLSTITADFDGPGFGNPGRFAYGSSAASTGSALLTYDGDNLAGLTNFQGLNLNLTEGGANSLNFDIEYDYPSNQTFNVEFTFYDKSDASGNTFSRGIYAVNERIQNGYQTQSLAFSALTIFGQNGAANLSNIGAFSIFLDGSRSSSGDFRIANINTNSTSTAVPEPTSVALLAVASGAVFRRKRLV